MHLLICGAGTALAMAGHTRRAVLWIPHVVGLFVMVSVSYDLGGLTVRYLGIAVLLALTLAAAYSLGERRERIESLVDALAMVVLIAAAPVMSLSTPARTGSHEMGGHSMSSAGTSLTLVIGTVLAWALARVLARWLAPVPDRSAARSSHLGVVGAAGSALMLAGMTLMSV